MKITTRILLVSLTSVVVMTASVLSVAVLLLHDSHRAAQQHLLQLELRGAVTAIQQRLDRSGLAAAIDEAQAQDLALRGQPGFASAELWLVDGADGLVLEHPAVATGGRVPGINVPALVQQGSGQVIVDDRLVVFDTIQPLGLLIGAGLGLNAVDAPLWLLLRAIGGVTFVALVLSAGAAMWSGRGLSRALSERTQEVQAGMASLAHSEARLRRLAESSLVGLCFWHIDEAITEANDTFLALIGRGRAELDAGTLTWRAITPPQDIADYEAARVQIRELGLVAPRERRFLRPDGAIVSQNNMASY